MKYRVLSLPGRGGPNPYVSLFYDALSEYDIELVGRLNFDIRWLKKNLDTFDAIHLHWPEALWRNYKGELVKEIRNINIPGVWRISNLAHKVIGEIPEDKKLLWFETCLNFLKKNNKKIIWTWHNVEPHESESDIDYLCNQILANYSDLILFHSEITEMLCRENYQIKTQTIIMPHGNYDGVYPEPRNNNIILKELGFSSEFPVVGFLGGIREYKGIDLACEAINELSDLNIQFVCAGAPYPKYNLDNLNSKLLKLNHAICIPREITDQEFSDFAHVCDFLLLPYRKVSGSGALLAFLTLNRGVVATDLPYFREVLAGAKHAGILFKPNDSSSLADSIREYLQVSPDIRNTEARMLADRYMWKEVVVPVSTYIRDNFMGCG